MRISSTAQHRNQIAEQVNRGVHECILVVMSEICIQVSGLKKSFGDVMAVDGISFSVRAGEIFGFLGPNGAGKTTTINMLTGLARPDAGTLAVGGVDCTKNPKAAQHLIGVVPDESNLYPELTGFGNLCFCGGLYGMSSGERKSRASELLALFGLEESSGRKFGEYSRGMKRRLTIAAGIMHRPPVLFLDEPTTGVDVQSARSIRVMLEDLHLSGTTVFLTTHYIEEAERMCDRVAFIVKGKIVREDTVVNLVRPVQGREVMMVSLNRGDCIDMRAVADAFPGYVVRAGAPGVLRFESPEPVRAGLLVRFLEEQGAEVTEARKKQQSLEDVFVDVTGIGAESMNKERGNRR